MNPENKPSEPVRLEVELLIDAIDATEGEVEVEEAPAPAKVETDSSTTIDSQPLTTLGL